MGTWALGDLGNWGIGDLGTSCSSCLIEIIENGLKLLEIDMGIWRLPIGSGVTRFPGLVFFFKLNSKENKIES